MNQKNESILIEDIFNEKIYYLIKNKIFLKQLLNKILMQKKIIEIEIDNEIKKDCLKEFMKKNNFVTSNDLKEYLLKVNVSFEDFEEELIKEKKINKFAMDSINEKEIFDLYLKSKDQYDNAKYYLLRFKDKNTALESYFQIENKEKTISEVFNNYAIKDLPNSSPLVGPILIEKGHPILQNKLRNMSPGDLCEPFLINKTWLIVKLENKSILDYSEQMKINIARKILFKSIDDQSNFIINNFCK